MTRVRAYGLTIASEIALDELPPCDPHAAADVTIRLAKLDPGEPASPGLILLDVRGVARFAIASGADIRVDPAPGASPDSVRLFLMGSALGALLHQRGLLVLHGNAVRIGDACLICVGPSGAGKSTLAAGFAARGYPPLADDVVAVTADHRALPGLPRIRLWQDAAERLGHKVDDLQRIRPGFDKFALPARPVAEALPVRWIHLIDVEARDDVACVPLRGLGRFVALRDNTYRPDYILRAIGESAHLNLCAGLAGHAAMFRTVRPAEGFSLETVIDTMLAHSQADGAPAL